jgi:N-acetylglutamate synthase-like GNAT family acetyltransferase
MSLANYQVRRATVDDLATLRSLWESMRLPGSDLEKRLTEFQVAVGPDGQVVGAVAFQIMERQARIHSEVFSDFTVADAVRPLFWERLHVLMLNHGIVRVWTQETAPFWKRQGLNPATPDFLRKLPAAWTQTTAEWLVLKLKEEEAIVSLEKELALFMESEKQRTARAFQQARVVRQVATFLAIALAIFVVIAMVFMLTKNPQVLTPKN